MRISDWSSDVCSSDLPNVTLVDTQGRGLDRITETGIVFDGVEYPVDCIIFATGFESGTNYARRAAMEVRGRDGKRMTDHFANGMRKIGRASCRERGCKYV